MDGNAQCSQPTPLHGITITNPFPCADGNRPQGTMLNQTCTGLFRIHNKTRTPVHLHAVRIANYGTHLRGFHGLMPQNLLKARGSARALDLELNTILQSNQQLLFQVSFTPKEVGCYRARILCDVSDGRVDRHICMTGEDEITRSVPRGRPYTRPKRKTPRPRKQQLVPGVPPPRSGLPFANPLKRYPVPARLKELVRNGKDIPELVQGLSPQTHQKFFSNLLFIEELQMEVDIQAYTMEQVTMRVTHEGYLALEVPGLAEKRPSVVYGDRIYASGLPGKKNKEYEGYVHDVALNEVLVKFAREFHHLFLPNLRFDIRFTFCRTILQRQHQALKSPACSIFTYPGPDTSTPRGPAPSTRPINRNLNEEQLSAVAEIVAKSGAPPYVIFGPPGTGKTVTLVEAILQVRQAHKAAVILACAPSNDASDVLARRLMEALGTTMLRLNAFSRANVPEDIRGYCNEFRSSPTLEVLLSYKVVVCTFMTAGILYALNVPAGHFTHIFLDEAGQGTEPETLIPIANMANRSTVVVMAGDQKQLGPIVRSPVALKYRLDVSLFERLIGSPPFAAADASSYKKDLVTKLVKNYRSHPSIVELPSRLFYGGEIVPCAGPLASSLLGWEYLPNKKFPVLFIGVEGRDEREDSSPSWFNVQEMSKVVEVVKRLRDIKRNKPACKDIGVITPYRKQVKKIQASFSRLKLQDITVGTVDQFQGQERRVIIISTVRSTRDPEIMSFDKKHNLGFLANPKRFNVAMTRAQALLVVIGNPTALYQDNCWKELIEYCRNNNSYKGPPPNPNMYVETVKDADGEFGFEDQAWRGAV